VPVPEPPFVSIALLYGPVPGVELIPYFLGLLAWVGVAIAAIFLAPIRALIRRLRNRRSNPRVESMSQSPTLGTPPTHNGSEPMPASVPESPDDGRRDRV
jgi:hypothetical protein